MIGEIMAVWFSTVHQLSMVSSQRHQSLSPSALFPLAWLTSDACVLDQTATYVVQDLCLHEEYVAPLTQEIRQHLAASSRASARIESLPLLDSFTKESIRCTNADAGRWQGLRSAKRGWYH